VPTEAMQRALGREGPKEIALATIAGAASSSCSYASAAISRNPVQERRRAHSQPCVPVCVTNLVLELGLILWFLMGWQFTAAEWIGGVVLVVIMAVLVRLTYPTKLVEEARKHPESRGEHEHSSMVIEGSSLWKSCVSRRRASASLRISRWIGPCSGRM